MISFINKNWRVLSSAMLLAIFFVFGQVGAMDKMDKMGKDKELMASISRDRTIKIWDISDINKDTKNEKPLKSESEISCQTFINLKPTSCFSVASFSPFDRNILVTASTDNIVRAWDISDIKNPKFIADLLDNLNNNDRIYSLLFSPFDKRIIALGSKNNYKFLDIFDMEKTKCIVNNINSEFSVVAFDPFNPKRFFVGSTVPVEGSRGEVRVLDISKIQKIKNESVIKLDGIVSVLECSPFYKNMFLVAGGKLLRLFDISDIKKPKVAARIERLNIITSASFSPIDKDRLILVAGGRAEIYDISDVKKPKMLKFLRISIRGHNSFIYGAFSPYDKDTIFLGLDNGEIKVFDISNIQEPRLIAILEGHSDRIGAIVFLPKIKKEEKFRERLLESTKLNLKELAVKKPSAPDVRIHTVD